MSYKTGRGNVTKKSLRFHATVKMVFDYQSVTKYTVAASRRWALTYAFWQWFGRAPAGVGPLEVRFAHPVRLSPATHSQGHGRPCLQRFHHRRGFCCHVAEAWNEDGMEECGGDGVKGKRR